MNPSKPITSEVYLAPTATKRRRMGRPAADDAENLGRYKVLLDPESVEVLKALGGGNLSAGARRAAALVRRMMEGQSNA